MFSGTRRDIDLPFTPVVIIGAARSGTNVLRDVLTQLPDFATWPCDEINPIWRHGNLAYPDDGIPPENATESVRRYVRAAFHRIWRRTGRPRFVVEKTCANSLRVPFVDRILPEARYLYIVRHGYDVVASAEKRWLGDLEMPGVPYFLAKARYAPLVDLPWYAMSAIRTRLAVLAGRREHLGVWGPRTTLQAQYVDMKLEEIVAHQWITCIQKSDRAFANMTPDKVFQTKYESFTDDAAGAISRIGDWLAVTFPENDLVRASKLVRSKSVGSGQERAEQISPRVRAMLAPTLKAHGYKE